jgi:putative addiction module component (TIGR02574 family)
LYLKQEDGVERHMGTREILANALKLKPQERLELADLLLESLDRPDRAIEEIWAEEAQRRLEAYRAGRLEGIPFDEVFGE